MKRRMKSKTSEKINCQAGEGEGSDSAEDTVTMALTRLEGERAL